MRQIRLLLATCLALTAAGCSIHPLPQDVTRFDTRLIVRKIRCEAREAILRYAGGAVRPSNPDLADRIASGTVRLTDPVRRQLPRDVQIAFERYDHAAIAYDFTFDITEKGSAVAGARLERLLTRGTFALGLQAGGERERQNTRNFRVVDTFEGLTTTVSPEFCKDFVQGTDWMYPITGRIGLDELVKTFLDLNQSGNLSGKDTGLPTIADTIEFTTKLSGSANPVVTLTPVGRGLQFVNAGITLAASREDIHKVIVAISLPDDPTEKVVRLKGGRYVATGRTIAEQRALNELDRQENRNFIDRFDRFQRRIEEIVD